MQEYPELLGTSTNPSPVWEYWQWLSGVMYQHFKRLGPKGSKGSARGYSKTWLTVHINENICHDALKGITVWGKYKKFDLNSNHS